MILHRLRDDERGIALITVLGLSLVLALLVTALLQYGVGSMRQARYDQDWHAALAAADAGVDDFLVRINRDSAYWQDADADCDDCSGTLDPDNPALHDFTTIRGGRSEYMYDVDASTIGANGVITVTSTGRVNDVDRTVSVQLRRRGFLDYIYFTEYETLDALAYSTTADQTWAVNNCRRHRYDSPSRPSSGLPSNNSRGCTDITWASSDTIDGPFHSNDQISVSGTPRWLGSASTSRPDGRYWDNDANRNCLARNNPAGCTSNPSFAEGLVYGESLNLPPSNNLIKAEADPALAGEGCMYAGATFIRLNAAGTATITSVRTDDPSSSKCPINGTMASLPDNGVIYVRSARSGESCLSSNPHPYTTTGDVTSYNRCSGDVYVEGTLDGRLTIAAENNVIISNSITYDGGRTAGSDDMLGLVANNFVEVMHPVNSSGSDIRYLPGNQRFESPHIDAAILSVEHSFRVQNYNRGSAFSNDLDVFGTIAQLFRGPVGTFSGSTTVTGYDKDYQYDPRLEFISPPHFLDPVQSAWSVRSWSEE